MTITNKHLLEILCELADKATIRDAEKNGYEVDVEIENELRYTEEAQETFELYYDNYYSFAETYIKLVPDALPGEIKQAILQQEDEENEEPTMIEKVSLEYILNKKAEIIEEVGDILSLSAYLEYLKKVFKENGISELSIEADGNWDDINFSYLTVENPKQEISLYLPYSMHLEGKRFLTLKKETRSLEAFEMDLIYALCYLDTVNLNGEDLHFVVPFYWMMEHGGAMFLQFKGDEIKYSVSIYELISKSRHDLTV